MRSSRSEQASKKNSKNSGSSSSNSNGGSQPGQMKRRNGSKKVALTHSHGGGGDGGMRRTGWRAGLIPAAKVCRSAVAASSRSPQDSPHHTRGTRRVPVLVLCAGTSSGQQRRASGSANHPATRARDYDGKAPRRSQVTCDLAERLPSGILHSSCARTRVGGIGGCGTAGISSIRVRRGWR